MSDSSLQTEKPEPRSLEQISDKEIFQRVVNDIVKTVPFYAVITLVLVGISRFSWWLAAVPAVIMAIVLAIATLQSLLNIVLLLICLPSDIYRTIKGLEPYNDRYAYAASILRLLEHVLMALLVYWLYSALWPNK